MSKTDVDKTRREKLDSATWIPRKEAARILKVSLPTILSWAGPRFRVREENSRSRIRWFVHAEDVERVRLQRLGPTMSELESFVLTEIAAGRTASEIVRSGRQVTLADIERIRDQDARLSGACIIDATTARELRQIFAIESMSAPLLLAHVRALRQRADALAGRLNSAAMAPARKASPCLDD